VSATPLRLTARWVLPGDGRALEGAAVVIDQGRIAALETRPQGPATDLGDTALVPGLVNCHTHLEFSQLSVPLQPAQPFTDWLRSLIAWRRSTPQDVPTAVALGAAEAIRLGTTCLADIATPGWTAPAAPQPHPRLFAFRESLGLRDEAHGPQLAALLAHLSAAAGTTDHERPTWSAGISPHAPYSVHPRLVAALIDLASAQNVTVAMHLAETPEELELLRNGTGPFVDFLSELCVWRADAIPPGTTPQFYLDQLARAPRALVVHGNYLTENELDLIAARPQLSLVYCPRTHAFFGHTPHPWKELLARGGRVVLGTDSRASNPDLSIFREAQFLSAQSTGVAPQTLLAMLTSDAAVALAGDRADFGRIAPGFRADLTVLSLPDPARIWNNLFAPASNPVGTLVGGRWLAEPPVRTGDTSELPPAAL
jgi:cytosine/adenosine deaminase-related metal-dependent hydrolase